MLSVWMTAACVPARRPAVAPSAHEPAAEPEASWRVGVDPRVEVFSMLQRAAGIPPYAPTGDARTPYARRVDAKLAALKDHPAVVHTQRLAEANGIGFDAPMALAVHLGWPGLEPLLPLSPLPAALDDRWAGVDVEAYLADVRAFVAAAELEAFFAEQAPFFAEVGTTLEDFLGRYDRHTTAWLERYSGVGVDEVVIVQGLLTEQGNYGPHVVLPDGRTSAYQIVVLWHPDAAGRPQPTEELLTYVIHETAHSYMNPLADAHHGVFAAGASALFAKLERRMNDIGYGDWETLVRESLTRAATRAYLRSIGAEQALADARVLDDGHGFVWIDDVIAALQPPIDDVDAAAVAAVLERYASDSHAR